jgi:DNA-binding SARP family transcriptional activator
VSRAAKVGKGLGALALLAALVGGAPWALWHFIGWPLPHGLPSWAQLESGLTSHGIPDMVLLKALACVVWVAWALLVASLGAELPATLRGRTPRHVVSPFQPLVSYLLTAVVVASLALSPRGVGMSARPVGASLGLVAPRPPAAVALVAQVIPDGAHLLAKDLAGPPARSSTAASRTYVVVRHDTLWGIAQRELGDPLRWREIYALNQGRAEPGGATLDDPNWIYPGWTLVLPSPPLTAHPHHASPPETTTAPRAPVTTVTTTTALFTTTTSPATTTPSTTVATSPATAATTPTTTATTIPAPVPQPVQPPASVPLHHGHPHAVPAAAVIGLPSGSEVAGSFASGVLAAVAIGRLRRRHGYRPSPPAPGRDLGPPPLGPTLRHLAAGLGETSPGLAATVLDDPCPELPEDDLGRREHPDRIEVGVDGDGAPVQVDLCELGGAGLVGPGADDVARSWVTATLTRAGPVASEVLIPAAVAGRLCPGLQGVPGVRVTETVEAAVRALEAAAVSRARKLADADCPDVAAYREANTWEPVPAVLAVLGPVGSELSRRLAPTLAAGSKLGLGAVLLGGPGIGCQIEVDQERRVARAEGAAAERLARLRLFGLAADEATDVLGVLAQAEERPESGPADANEGALPPKAAEASRPEPWPVAILDGPEKSAPIVVRLFGPYEITSAGETVATGLRNIARELLAWYLLRPEGATIDAAVDSLWPDTEPNRVHKRFWLAATNLQTRLCAKAGDDVRLFVKVGEAYRLARELVNCDVWGFQAALSRAGRAADDRAVLEALQAAVEVYRGDFAQGTDYLWSEPVRQDLHRRALDALLRVAELEERLGSAAAAEVALDRAIELDLYAEEPYRRLMALQARTRGTGVVHRTWRLLQQRLGDLDLDCEPATTRLFRSLTESPVEDVVAQLQARRGYHQAEK